MSGSVRNVVVANCVFDGTQRGLRVKTSLGRGGVVENFRASNLVMRNITDTAFSVTAAYDREAKESAGSPAPEAIPVMRHIHWSDIIVANVNKVAELSGLEQSALEDFSLRQVQVTGAKSGIRCANAKGVVLEDIQLQPAAGPAVTMQSVSEVDILRLLVTRPNTGAPVLSFQNVSNALLRQCKVAEGSGVFLGMTGDANPGITCEANRLPAGLKEQAP